MAARIVHPPIQIGDRFGRLVITKIYQERTGKQLRIFCSASCACGSYVEKVRNDALRNGSTSSCGCILKNKRAKVGDKYGKLTVTNVFSEKKGKQTRLYCSVICECGNQVARVADYAIQTGKTKSCRGNHPKYPDEWSRTREAFSNAKQRCTNVSNPCYPNYGGRGLTFDFKNVEELIAHIGIKPTGFDLDRIDNNKGYCLGNVRWVSRKENQANRRISTHYFVDGIKYDSAQDAAIANKVKAGVIRRWCEGRKEANAFYPPKPNCWVEKKYQT
jgi:hypothetical protein